MAEIIGAAIEVQVVKAMTVHVIQVVTFAAVDNQINAHILPILCFGRVPEKFGSIDYIAFFAAHRMSSIRIVGRIM